MTKAISKRQKELLGFIHRYIKNSGYPPTFEEMKEKLSVASNQAVIDLLGKLEKYGFLKREEGQARGMKILSKGFQALGVHLSAPVAGTSAAGPFTESYADTFSKWMDLPGKATKYEGVKQSGEDVFVLQVSGDSMVNAGINDGDILLVKKTNEFKSGDIVVARNGDGTTIKRFIKEGKKAYLKPENLKYALIPITEETSFEGKVVFNLTAKTKVK